MMNRTTLSSETVTDITTFVKLSAPHAVTREEFNEYCDRVSEYAEEKTGIERIMILYSIPDYDKTVRAITVYTNMQTGGFDINVCIKLK